MIWPELVPHRVPDWMAWAYHELSKGLAEVPGTGANPRILEYFRYVDGLPSSMTSSDETSWCSAGMNAAMAEVGIQGTRNAAARSWLTWGVEVPVGTLFSVCVLWRESKDSWKGHVGLVAGFTGAGPHAGPYLLGGNQGDRWSIQRYPLEQVLGCRWPSGALKGD